VDYAFFVSTRGSLDTVAYIFGFEFGCGENTAFCTDSVEEIFFFFSTSPA
jgi:hypothetical protein